MNNSSTLPIAHFDQASRYAGIEPGAALRWLRGGFSRWLESLRHPMPQLLDTNDGELRRQGELLLWRHRRYSGRLVETDSQDAVVALYRVRRGKLHGCCRRWFSDGSLHSESRYCHGQPRGLQKTYCRGGRYQARWISADGSSRPY